MNETEVREHLEREVLAAAADLGPPGSWVSATEVSRRVIDRFSERGGRLTLMASPRWGGLEPEITQLRARGVLETDGGMALPVASGSTVARPVDEPVLMRLTDDGWAAVGDSTL